MYHVAPSDERALRNLPFCLITAGHGHAQEMRDRPNGMESHHIFVVEKGVGIFESAQGRQRIEAGTAIFLPKRYPHKYYGTDDTLRTGWVTFDGCGAEGLLNYFRAEPMARCPAEELNPGTAEFCRMIQRKESPERISAELYRLLVSFFTATKRKAEPRLEQAKQFIEKNYAKDLPVDDIAAAAGISPSLLYRLFRENGQTPVEYLRRVRIEKAKEFLLNDPRRNVLSVSEGCGFSDFSYFCKVFREETGVTPGCFRKKYLP